MDIKQYYKKLHELEATIQEPFVVVVSKETADGGRAGVLTEVSRRNASQLILEGRAEPASTEEAEAYRESEASKRQEFQQEQAASKVQFKLVQVEPKETSPTETGK